jgi:hypothetical protein
MGKPGVFKKISDQDKTITPFKVNRSWSYTTTASLEIDGIRRLAAIKPNPAVYSGNKVTLDSWQTQADSASLLINTTLDSEASMVWYSLNHLYYKRAGKPFETFGYSDPAAIERTIFDEASVISIPQTKFGEAIQPGSVILNFVNNVTNISMSFVDDGQGNLIDTALSSSISNELLYLGFNAMTYSPFWESNPTADPVLGWWQRTKYASGSIQNDTTIQDLDVTAKNILIVPADKGYNVIGKYAQNPYGNTVLFNSGSYIRIPNNDTLNFKRSEDFAIGMWVGHDSTNTSPATASLLTKRTTAKQNVRTKKGITQLVDYNLPITQYPYDIRILEGTILECRTSDGSNTVSITYPLPEYTVNHILLQKTGSLFELYVNGERIEYRTISNENFHNEADIFIGSSGLTNNGYASEGFNGSIDEFIMFSKGLTPAEITQLSDASEYNSMTTNTNAVGNVFYEHGIIVISDPRLKYTSSSFRLFNDALYNYKTLAQQPGCIKDFYFEYNSTMTLYEHEYVCRAKEDEFNFTSNSTIRQNNDENSEVPKDFVANEYFAPYITTVGLYDKYGRLLAIGKLGTPIHKRDDVDLNLIVRFDM